MHLIALLRLNKPGQARWSFDLRGRSVGILVDKWQSAGRYEIPWDGLLEELLDDSRPPARLIAAEMLNEIGTQTAKEIMEKNTHKSSLLSIKLRALSPAASEPCR